MLLIKTKTIIKKKNVSIPPSGDWYWYILCLSTEMYHLNTCCKCCSCLKPVCLNTWTRVRMHFLYKVKKSFSIQMDFLNKKLYFNLPWMQFNKLKTLELVSTFLQHFYYSFYSVCSLVTVTVCFSCWCIQHKTKNPLNFPRLFSATSKKYKKKRIKSNRNTNKFIYFLFLLLTPVEIERNIYWMRCIILT